MVQLYPNPFLWEVFTSLCPFLHLAAFWEFWAIVQPKINIIAKLSPSRKSNFSGGWVGFFSWLIWSPTNIDLNLHFHNNDPLRKVVGDMIEPSLNSISIQIGQKRWKE